MATFGSYIEVEAQPLFDLTTVRPKIGCISGIYRTAINDDKVSFTEVGILSDD